MNYRTIANVFGTLLIVIGCSMVLPIACSLHYGEGDLHAIALSAVITVLMGLICHVPVSYTHLRAHET